ncbi:MAG: coproporphyrinogen III oxidase [Zetaproteobacteria bacterium CG06_land_8_20_14_3_00_59_53]|nr:MAG: coproporphyrinogen III oxidase [Zetaproteobacteria bacterium CG2_30_59_37]PIO88847.1 MAG: coproporphyrinogen III oxidase [Zetaproteobacteria bacterium CG23_combo_of_CG06-09_8_20_14_all_59_86]PIU70730.1 MAG: coproporphyrinogen III oxidase [Zetaproteobacteria bacterium CG06_land_8_20_14_3_00_59_53]PIU96400.1 MAG: coproporphyrinogen III oxidase [Zetaproteobacteria bacterium CG03_land_8_20_14_0_80_59_51]PIY45273.1 MAG: coproporphyrinogen III oxidase [Zetaproteobacteria bacterium CG_4_10_14_
MKRTPARSPGAARALALVSALQQRFVNGLEKLAREQGRAQRFSEVEWLRDGGAHGGGMRFETADGDLFGRGSVNVSQVHYDDMPEKKLSSANAISTIIHPLHPLAPSAHIHISWTEMRDGSGYWRMMADLNPSNELETDKLAFFNALKKAAPHQFDEAKAQGERYFFIPVLGRHRGVAHFYLENFNSGHAAEDLALATAVGEAAIDSYLAILSHALNTAPDASEEQRALQLAYHTLYFFQVLTLDRGTTTGLLVHDQNDVGIMGSLPARVDRELLASWIGKMPAPQDKLLAKLIAALPDRPVCVVDEAVKAQLAAVVRAHYREHPEAIAMQASGEVIPPTVQNHS